MQVNMLEAKTNLSKLVKKLETKEESVITLARGGVPVARIVPYDAKETSLRLGAALRRGIRLPKDADLSFESLTKSDAEIADLFWGGEDE